MQKIIITILIAIVLFYLLWAIIYHKRSKSLTLTIFIEYLLTAALALVLVMGVQF